MAFEWQHGTLGPNREGSGETSKLIVSTSRAGSGLRLSREIGSNWDGDSTCSGGSPHRGASRGHRCAAAAAAASVTGGGSRKWAALGLPGLASLRCHASLRPWPRRAEMNPSSLAWRAAPRQARTQRCRTCASLLPPQPPPTNAAVLRCCCRQDHSVRPDHSAAAWWAPRTCCRLPCTAA